ncbi:MAG: hypothetical protein N4A46_08450 [Schleiferiaceae bacterium]|jgi:hypothetical protein|nr:hypothetical protein [Schleiferiaceae bacterium]
MKKFLALVLSCFAIVASNAQPTSEEEALQMMITRMFEAMNKSEGHILERCFSEDAILETLYTKDGEKKIHRTSAKDFIEQVSLPRKEDWKEQINGWTIHIDGDLASIWTPYTFYLDGEISHCGINSFQLRNTNKEGWKITYVIDTRRREGCD